MAKLDSYSTTSYTGLQIQRLAASDTRAMYATGKTVRSAVDYVENGSTTIADQGDVYRKAGKQLFTSWDDAENFRIVAAPGVVNNLAVEGAIANTQPVLFARGSDTNISMAYAAKGTGSHYFGNGRGTLFEIADFGEIPSGVLSYLTIRPGHTGAEQPRIEAPDYIDLNCASGGASDTSYIRFLNGGNLFARFAIVTDVAPTMYPEISAGTDYVRITANGSATNRPFLITAGGTGAFNFWNGGGSLLTVDSGSLSTIVNSVLLRGTQTGVAPKIRSNGEANGSLEIGPTSGGTGTVQINALNVINRSIVTGVTYSTQTTGFSVTASDTVAEICFTPAGVLATGTLTMPASPYDGQTLTVSTTQTITALTVSANSGQSITGAPSTITTTTPFTMRYRSANLLWRRVG